MQAKLLLVELKAARGDNDVVFSDGRVARAPRHAVAKDEIEPNLHFPRSAFADCVRTFNANDFNFPPTIAGIIVVQNLAGLEHSVSPPLGMMPEALEEHDHLTAPELFPDRDFLPGVDPENLKPGP